MSNKYEIHIIDAKRSWRWRPEELAGFLPHFLEWQVELASALRKRGHGVIVYYDGVDTDFCSVSYRKRKEYDKKGQVQIYWGDVNALIPGSEAEAVFYFSNSYEVYGDKVPSFKDVDCIVTKSQAHFEGLSAAITRASPTPEDINKIISMMPGLDRGQFGASSKREEASFLYASPWDQGLERVLRIWPKIREVIKNAKLYVCYGGGFNARMQGKKQREIEGKYATGLRQHGIETLGCVDRSSLGNLMRRVQCVLVPSSAPETFGATAYKAQFAGAIPITTDDTALVETVRDGGISVPWKDFLGTAIQVATNEGIRDIIFKKQRQIIFPTWDEVASAWEEEIRIRIEANKNGNQDEEANFS